MKNLARVIRTTGMLSKEEIENVLKDFPDTDSEAAWKAFLKHGITEEQIFESLAKVMNIRFIDAKRLILDEDALDSLPKKFCRTERIFPLKFDKDTNALYVGTDNPNNLPAFSILNAKYSFKIVKYVITQSAVQQIINQHYRQDDEISDLSDEIGETAIKQEDETAFDLTDDDDGSPVVRVVNLMISQAIRDRASDIHIEPSENFLEVFYRIDGVRHGRTKADKSIQSGIISRLKVMADIDIAERRVPQDGRMSVLYTGRRYDIRMTTLPTVWGEKIVMRILDSSVEQRSVSSIQMSKRNEDIFLKALQKPHGMILVTGPTGSGKSTSLYISLEHVANPKISVVTVEDPVEKRIKGVAQMQVNNRAGMTFSRALRSILRADPDIVLIGEIRDSETAKIAIDASMTGHLVLSTLHTNGAPEAPSRLIEMDVEPYLVGSSVSCVVAQRLARRLCNDCKVPVEIDPDFLYKSGYPFSPEDSKFFKPVGCASCSEIGYAGRVAITEVMEMTEEIEQLIIKSEPARIIRRQAEKSGMVPLQQDGFDKVRQGMTTIEEVFRVTA